MEKLEVSKWDDNNRDEVKGVILSRGKQALDISFQGNRDLYFSLNDHDKNNTFVVGKDNHDVYSAFDNLYKSVMSCNVVGLDYRRTARKTGLIKGKKIIWRSDNYDPEVAPYLEIERLDNAYLLKIKSPTPQRQLDCLETLGLDRPPLVVKFGNSGSAYAPFNVPFVELFHRLRDIDTNVHQIHMDEYIIDKQLETGKSLKKILCHGKKSA